MGWKWEIGNPVEQKLGYSSELDNSKDSKIGQDYSKWKWNIEKPALPPKEISGIDKKDCTNKCKIIDGKYVCKKQCAGPKKGHHTNSKGRDQIEGYSITEPTNSNASASYEEPTPKEESEEHENEFDIDNRQGNLAKMFESWGQNYQIMFNIKVTNLPGRKLNFMHFTTGKDCCEKGTRVPAVFLDQKNGKPVLEIDNTYATTRYEIELYKDYLVNLIQKDGMFSITINSKNVKTRPVKYTSSGETFK